MINEINILMTCRYMLKNTPENTSVFESIDETHEVHSTYLNHTDSLEALRHYKYEDELNGDNFTKYWIVVAAVFDKAP